MLYVTTRSNQDTYTAYWVLNHDRGPDGGSFVPLHSPCFETEEVETFLKLPFADAVAGMLNRILGLRLTAWDVNFYVGRFPARVEKLGSRLLIAQNWHNPGWSFDQTVQNLMPLLYSEKREEPTEWVRIAVRMAMLVGVLGQLLQGGGELPVDIAGVSGDFESPISAWYLRQWGFPVGNILCCCNENGSLWDLFANGQMRTDCVSAATKLPLADVVVPKHFERLVYGCGGTEEAKSYAAATRCGRTYIPRPELLKRMSEGLYVSVVSTQRLLETLPRVYSSRGYLLSPYDMLCYCGVSDFWSRYAQINPVLLLSDRSPRLDLEVIAQAMGLSVQNTKEKL